MVGYFPSMRAVVNHIRQPLGAGIATVSSLHASPLTFTNQGIRKVFFGINMTFYRTNYAKVTTLYTRLLDVFVSGSVKRQWLLLSETLDVTRK